MNELKPYDIVSVVTNKRQDEEHLATVLELGEFEGEPAAVIQYHYNECRPQTVAIRYMKLFIARDKYNPQLTTGTRDEVIKKALERALEYDEFWVYHHLSPYSTHELESQIKDFQLLLGEYK